MVDIPAEATSWPSPDPYIQDAIDGESAGTTFLLKAGVHRMQNIQLRTNDTLNFEAGAILRGSQDIKGLSWAKDGANERWFASISDIGTVNGTFRSGYDNRREHPILDGVPMAYKTSASDVDPDTAYYDPVADKLYIGINPSTLSTVELSRTQVAIEADASNTTGVTVKGDRGTPGIIENYASGAQSENAGLRIGRYGSSNITNAAWTLQDMVVRNFRGMAIGHGDGCLISRVDCYYNGQIGIGGTDAAATPVTEYSSFHANAMGGWSAGWEAGNSKWVRTENHVTRGCWFDSALLSDGSIPTHLSIVSTIWWDIGNDGALIYGNHILDRAEAGGRGIFWEISYSCKIYNNILFRLAHEAGNSHWSNTVVMSESGPAGASIFADTLVYDNIGYECSGGMKSVQSSRGSGILGEYLVKDIHSSGNAFQIKPGFGYTGTNGEGGDTTSAWGEDMTYEDNLYVVDDLSSNHWFDSGSKSVGGVGSADWSEWQAEGFDTGGDAILRDTNLMANDIHPYRGGAL